jgi:O-antigen ligase
MTTIDNQAKRPLPSWQMLIYLIMIGFTFISMPKNEMTFLVSRAIQAIELLFFAALIIQFSKHPQKPCSFNIWTNLWWLIYTLFTYFFATGMGLTPMFKWMNVMIFLLLGSCYWRDNFQDSLRHIAKAFSILIYLNAILLILYPRGLWIDTEWVGRGDPTRYLFGNYNQIGFVCLLGITAHAMYTLATKEKMKKLIFLIIVSLWSVLTVGSMTSAVGLSILAMYVVLHKHIKRPQLWLCIFLIFYIGFFITFIWLGNSIQEIHLITSFVEGTLSKDSSFSGRTDIWNNAVELIQQSPWIGYGVQNVEWNDQHLEGSGAHNMLLTLLLQGGLFLTSIFIFIVLLSVTRAYKARHKATTLGIVSLCILFLMSLFEAYYIQQVFLLLQFVFYSSLISPDQYSDNQEKVKA